MLPANINKNTQKIKKSIIQRLRHQPSASQQSSIGQPIPQIKAKSQASKSTRNDEISERKSPYHKHD